MATRVADDSFGFLGDSPNFWDIKINSIIGAHRSHRGVYLFLGTKHQSLHQLNYLLSDAIPFKSVERPEISSIKLIV